MNCVAASLVILAGGCFIYNAPSHADTIFWIADYAGHIGQVDINTQSVVAGSVHSTGLSTSDIAFDTAGNLYVSTYTNFYLVNQNTGAATHIGSFNAGSGGMDALVGSGTGGTLLAASNKTTEIYSISTSTGVASPFASSLARSAGDLAFAGTTLYESAIASNLNDELVDVTTDTVIRHFRVGSTSGEQLGAVLALADDGTTMYAVDGTEVYSVDLSDAVLTPLFDYSLQENGQDLVHARGAAFVGEGSSSGNTPVPEPMSLALLGSGIASLGLLQRRSK